jgi:hypothetical protein
MYPKKSKIWMGGGEGVDRTARGACPWTPASVVARAFGQAMSDLTRGRGGTHHTLTPSPQAAISIKPRPSRTLHRRIMISLKFWPGHGSLGTPLPHMRASRPPPTFLCSVTMKCLFKVHYAVEYAADHVKKKIFLLHRSCVHCVYIYVCLNSAFADLAHGYICNLTRQSS